MYHHLFTVGYAGLSMAGLIDNLHKNKVEAVVDVRSSPYSMRWPEFNQPALKQSLNEQEIYYLAMGNSLGARPSDSSLYTGGIVDFNKMATSSIFLEGCSRVISGLKSYPISLLCSESDPIHCHRSILVAREITVIEPLVKVFHIHKSGCIESHPMLIKRLLSLHRLDQEDLLRTYEERISSAFKLQERKIAYKES